ncbi:MAG: ECF transporter S component [Culicoidibacterales bacterium]
MKLNMTTRQIALTAILSAFTMVLALTPLGLIPINPVISITIIHIPVIIAAIVVGPASGMIVGLVFGIFSMINATVNPSLLSPIFLNPIVAIIPRVLIGFVSGYVYLAMAKITKKQLTPIAVGVAATAGTLMNTIGVLGMIYVFYGNFVYEVTGVSVGPFLGSLIVTNSIPELIIGVIVIVLIVKALSRTILRMLPTK